MSAIQWYTPSPLPPWHEPAVPQFSTCCTARLISTPCIQYEAGHTPEAPRPHAAGKAKLVKDARAQRNAGLVRDVGYPVVHTTSTDTKALPVSVELQSRAGRGGREAGRAGPRGKRRGRETSKGLPTWAFRAILIRSPRAEIAPWAQHDPQSVNVRKIACVRCGCAARGRARVLKSHSSGRNTYIVGCVGSGSL